MKGFNVSWFIVGLIAGLLLGVITGYPITSTALGVVAGITLALAIGPKKKSCCQ